MPLARALVAGGHRGAGDHLAHAGRAGRSRGHRAKRAGRHARSRYRFDAADLRTARSLQARFVVSPGATPELLDAAAAGELPFLPGVQTASEVMAALARGFDVLKFFPAGQAGGPAMLRALAGPFPQVRFCPTGGVGEDNFVEWLALPNVVAIGGSWLAPAAEVRAGDWAAITARAHRAVAKLRQAKGPGTQSGSPPSRG